MFLESKCDKCGDCLVMCQYVDYNRDKAVQNITNLMEGKDAEILAECITCMGCNEYCEKGANPFDLICELQEKRGILPVPEGVINMIIEEMTASPNVVIRGLKGKPALTLCIAADFLPKDAYEGEMFDGLTIVRGTDYFCHIAFLHTARESLVRQNAQRFVDKLASLGVHEIICIHIDCYAMLTKQAQDYNIKVPFRPVHIIEYLLNYMKEHQSSIHKLNRNIAYQRPCISRYVPEKEQGLDELFDLIGVHRVARKYDGKNPLCCGIVYVNQNRDRALQIRDMNLTDAKEHGAEAVVFSCPLCFRALSQRSEEYGLVPLFITELCRMALGEKSFP